MKKAIIGAGGFAREVYFSHTSLERENIYFFISDELYNSSYNDLKVFPLSSLNINEYEVIVAIGDPEQRSKIVNSLPTNTKYFTYIHPSVQILDYASCNIGKGSIICAGTILTTNINIGDHCHLNLHTTIGHDTTLNNFITTAPGVKISGNCIIDNLVYLGTNCSIKQKIKICSNVTIGMNAAVVKDILLPGTYVGVPAKYK